eukprot:scaffold2901_cov99-Isochrysis_galbana.AAC.5
MALCRELHYVGLCPRESVPRHAILFFMCGSQAPYHAPCTRAPFPFLSSLTSSISTSMLDAEKSSSCRRPPTHAGVTKPTRTTTAGTGGPHTCSNMQGSARGRCSRCATAVASRRGRPSNLRILERTPRPVHFVPALELKYLLAGARLFKARLGVDLAQRPATPAGDRLPPPSAPAATYLLLDRDILPAGISCAPLPVAARPSSHARAWRDGPPAEAAGRAAVWKAASLVLAIGQESEPTSRELAGQSAGCEATAEGEAGVHLAPAPPSGGPTAGAHRAPPTDSPGP